MQTVYGRGTLRVGANVSRVNEPALDFLPVFGGVWHTSTRSHFQAKFRSQFMPTASPGMQEHAAPKMRLVRRQKQTKDEPTLQSTPSEVSTPIIYTPLTATPTLDGAMQQQQQQQQDQQVFTALVPKEADISTGSAVLTLEERRRMILESMARKRKAQQQQDAN